MALKISSAIRYNKSRLYSQKAIGIIQFFANCRTTGVFDKQTIEAVYKFQQSPLYSFPVGFADGMVGPATLGVIIMELEYAMRKPEATVLRAYAYKIQGVLYNPGQNYPMPPPPSKEELPEPEEVSVEDKDKPRQATLHDLRNFNAFSDIMARGGGPSHRVGALYLGPKDTRLLIGGSCDFAYYLVVQTDCAALDPFMVGKFFRQTTRGFSNDIRYASAAAEVGTRTRGGQAMMKKEVELLMGAATAGVGAFGGFAALTASSMQFLLLNSKELFAAARGFGALMEVRAVLKANAPEFWKMTVALLKLSLLKTPEAMWSDKGSITKIVGELAMYLGVSLLSKNLTFLGGMSKLIPKLLAGVYGKATEVAAVAFASKDFLAAIRQCDPTISEEKANIIVTELRDNWKVVGPALTALNAAIGGRDS